MTVDMADINSDAVISLPARSAGIKYRREDLFGNAAITAMFDNIKDVRKSG